MNKSLLLTLGSEFGMIKEAIFQDTFQNRSLAADIKENFKSQFEANILCYNSMVNDTFQNLANQVNKNVDIITSEKFCSISEIIRNCFSSITILNMNQDYLQDLARENKKQLGAVLDQVEKMSNAYGTSSNLDLSVSLEDKTDFILSTIDQNLGLLKEFYDAKILELKDFIASDNEEILSKIVTNERETIEGTVSRETQTLNDEKEDNGNNHPSSSSGSDSDDGDDPPNNPEINQECEREVTAFDSCSKKVGTHSLCFRLTSG
jgi:hypothetical protein